MKLSTIALIGAGNIGFRHFQSLCNLTVPCNIIVIDTNKDALTKSMEYANTINNKMINISYRDDIDYIDDYIDVAIIATTSLVRRAVFEKLVNKTNVKNIIFEKFLFPSLEEYDIVKRALDINGINAFINTPGRLFPGYINLKKRLNNPKHIDAFMYGSNWGLACNAIHIIDQIAFLLSSYEALYVDASGLAKNILNSKRNGYIEFTGRISCQLGERANIVMCSDLTKDIAPTLTIFADDTICTLSEVEQKILISKNCQTTEQEFPIYYQSQLTSLVVTDLLEKNICRLTRYDDTLQWHKALLSAFLGKYREFLNCDKNICPIT